MTASLPCFAVVGHPNKGKSSVVSALTQQDQIAISELSGTTTVAQTFTLNIAGQTLYQLVDTPGFQRPRQLLELLQQQNPNASERLGVIKRFLSGQSAGAEQSLRFKDEMELLKPIIRGASIIYVVDGSVPYTPEYEAEMTILQWTGQPRMALINPICGEQYVEQWQQALSQYFSLVRVFNPMTANREQQTSVLSAFEELNPIWRESLARARQAIVEQGRQTREQSAAQIAQYLARVLSHSMSVPLAGKNAEHATQRLLQTQYQAYLKAQEQALQHSIKALYAQDVLQTESGEVTTEYPDLLDQGHWYLFGLSRKKLLLLAASGGAAAGAVIDVGLGGASLLTGSLLGGVTSAAASFYFTEAPEKIRIKNAPLGGKTQLIGPVKNLQFAFVLLGRAVSYHAAVSQHSHADRAVLEVSENPHWLDTLDKTQQIKLTQLLQKAHKGFTGGEVNKLQALLDAALKPV